MNLSEWLTDVNGRTIGAGECWDLAQDYYTRVIGGGTLYTHPSNHAGYAIGVWDGYGANGTEQFFTQASPTAIALPGWLAIWKWGSAIAPTSHIAVTVADAGVAVDCESQNPGAAHRQMLLKTGLAGYLVPRNGGTASGVNLASDTSGGNSVGNAIDSVTTVANQIATIQHFFAVPGQWQRIGLYAMGILILLSAVIYIFKDDITDTMKAAI